MNLCTCAKCGPDRSSGLEAFPDLLIYDPLTPPCPSGIKGPNLVPIGPAVWHDAASFPFFLICDPSNPLQIPIGARG